MTQYLTVPIGGQHRESFDCGVDALNRYLRTQATQDIRRRVANCFVALAPDETIAGYYTFAAASIPTSDLSPEETKRSPKYPRLPAALIGRLAVDRRFRGRRLGEALVADAILRAKQSAPAVFGLLVDAKDENTAGFYTRLGFRPLASRPLSLFLSIASAEQALHGR